MLLITQPDNGSEIVSLSNYAHHDFSWDVINAPSGWRLDEIITKLKLNGVPYGTQLFCEVIAQQMNWQLTSNNFDWLSQVNKDYLQRNVCSCKLQDALKINENQFVKPADLKLFDAKVYSPNEIKEVIEKYKNDNSILNSPILISDVVNFVSEYRFFVSHGCVRTGCCYLINGEVNNSKNWFVGLDEVQNKLTSWLENDLTSNPAVIDVGVLDDGKIAIIETNPAWASGIYGCSLDGVLTVLQESCYFDD